jgi:hypothetical protein
MDLDWQKVPKQWTVGHHEALRALLSFCGVFSIFLCCLLFAGDELCFAVFMEWAALCIDQTGVLCCLWTRCVMEDSGWQV